MTFPVASPTASIRSSARTATLAAAVATWVLMAAALTGCRGGRVLSGGTGWPFAPASLRVHPLTHVALPRVNAPLAGAPTTAEQGAILEVYIELLDVDGFDTRGVGELRVQVSSRGDASLPNLEWTVDLRELDVNRMYFDWVTRTYRLPLVLDWPRPPRGGVAVVEASLTLEGSGTLRGRGEVSWPSAR